MVELTQTQHRALMQNLEFVQKHTPEFIEEFTLVYGNNAHRLPFMKDYRAFADNPEHPEIIIVECGGLRISANPACGAYDKALAAFLRDRYQKNRKDLWVSLASEALAPKIIAIFSKQKTERLIRYNFRLDKEAFRALPDWRGLVPPGFSVKYFDTQSFEFLKKHGKTEDCWFPASKRFAFATLHEGKIASECFSVFVDEGTAEVGIHTDECFRRQGLASLTSMAFIEHCLNEGLEPNWGCWNFNHDSAALARKLGFELYSEVVCIRVTRRGLLSGR